MSLDRVTIFQVNDFYKKVCSDKILQTFEELNKINYLDFKNYFENKILIASKEGKNSFIFEEEFTKEQKDFIFYYNYKFNIEVYNKRVEVSWNKNNNHLINQFLKLKYNDRDNNLKDYEYFKVLDIKDNMVKIDNHGKEYHISLNNFDINSPLKLNFNAINIYGETEYYEGYFICYFDWQDQIRFRNQEKIQPDIKLTLFPNNKNFNLFYCLVNENKIISIHRDQFSNVQKVYLELNYHEKISS